MQNQLCDMTEIAIRMILYYMVLLQGVGSQITEAPLIIETPVALNIAGQFWGF